MLFTLWTEFRGEFWGLSKPVRLSVPWVSLKSIATHLPCFVFTLSCVAGSAGATVWGNK